MTAQMTLKVNTKTLIGELVAADRCEETGDDAGALRHRLTYAIRAALQKVVDRPLYRVLTPDLSRLPVHARRMGYSAHSPDGTAAEVLVIYSPSCLATTISWNGHVVHLTLTRSSIEHNGAEAYFRRRGKEVAARLLEIDGSNLPAVGAKVRISRDTRHGEAKAGAIGEVVQSGHLKDFSGMPIGVVVRIPGTASIRGYTDHLYEGKTLLALEVVA